MRLSLFGVVLVAALWTIVAAKDEFYKTLGVSKTAKDAEIKKAYRKLAKKWHPDRFRDEKEKEKAERKFMKIAEAYETLTDPEKRRMYDQVGDDYDKYSQPGAGQGRGSPRGNQGFRYQQSGPGGFSGFENFGHFHSQKSHDFASFAGNNIFSQFSSMFGGGAAGS